MVLPSWWQVTTPHRDIRDGTFTEAVFAADLGDVVSGRAPEAYGDARSFMTKTYVTTGIKTLVRNVFQRLADGRGDAVIQLQTPFGGGKTHALVTLYHMVKSYGAINHLQQVRELTQGLPLLAQPQVAVFVGTNADPVGGRTPWGEIAHQLGSYEVVQEHDRRRVAPGKDLLRDVLNKAGPTLILIDELLEYIVKAARTEQLAQIAKGQTLAFLQELSEVVAASDKHVLVLTLPSSALERYDEEAERSLNQLQHTLGRIETIYAPVEGVEIYEIVRRRLFESYGDESTQRQAAEAYFNLYQGLGSDVPPEVREVSYRDRLERAFPFHPELIDVLYERWGSFHTFQRTRGVLRLLAEVVADLYRRRTVSPTIHSSLVNLNRPQLRREFVKHIGNEYDTVIAADITNKARHIDKDMGSEYERYGIGQGLATSAFLWSFSGGERRGTTLSWLRVALLREGIPSTIVGDAMNKLTAEDGLWYLHHEGTLYRFLNAPNLNRVIVDREETVGAEQVEDTIRDRLDELLRGSGFGSRVHCWPRATSDIPDSTGLKLVVLDPDHPRSEPRTEQFISTLYRPTEGKRVYSNVVFCVAVDQTVYQLLQRTVRRYLALDRVARDDLIGLNPSAKREVETKLLRAKKDIPVQLVSSYRHLCWHSNAGMVWRDMGGTTLGQDNSLAQRVWQYLVDNERILTVVTPRLLLDKAFGSDETAKPLRDVYELFCKTPGLPCIESEAVIVSAVTLGVPRGLMAVRVDGRVYFNESVPHSLNPECSIVRPEAIEVVPPPPPPPGPDGNPPAPGPDGNPPPPGPDDPPPRTPGVQQVFIRTTVPWDKISELIRGVLLPLKTPDSQLRVAVEIDATSREGFARTTLDSRVRETLQQIGAAVETWKEDGKSR